MGRCRLLALTWGGHQEPDGYPWYSPQIGGLLFGCLLLTSLFLFIETRAKESILPLLLFKQRMVSVMSVVAFGLGAIILGVSVYIPLFIQIVQGQSAAGSGAITTPMAIAMMVANIATGQFISRVGRVKVPVISGAIFILLTEGLVVTLDANSKLWQLTLYMVLLGIGIGQVLPTMSIAIQEAVGRQQLGVGTATVQFFG